MEEILQNVQNPVNHGINYQPQQAKAGFLPSTALF